MYQILLGTLLVLCGLIAVVVLMQPMRSNGANSLSGGAEELFGRQKARGFEAVMQRLTYVLLFVFFALCLALAYLSSK